MGERRGRGVTERPTYDWTLLPAKLRSGAPGVIHMVDLEPDGIDVDALAELLARGAPALVRTTIPHLQNPAGWHRFRAGHSVVPGCFELAAQGARVQPAFEDDPYVELRFEGEPLPTMLSLDDASAWSTPPRSPRPSARGSGSATSGSAWGTLIALRPAPPWPRGPTSRRAWFCLVDRELKLIGRATSTAPSRP